MVDLGELRSVPLFGSLASGDLATLAERADLVEAEAGVDLTREGDFGHCVFAIVDGTAAVTVDGAPVRELGPGDLFGEIAVLASGRRTATVTSSSPMVWSPSSSATSGSSPMSGPSSTPPSARSPRATATGRPRRRGLARLRS